MSKKLNVGKILLLFLITGYTLSGIKNSFEGGVKDGKATAAKIKLAQNKKQLTNVSCFLLVTSLLN